MAIIAAAGWQSLNKADVRAGTACLLAVAFVAVIFYLKAAGSDNAYQIARIEYVTMNTSPDDYVYDGDIQFNIYRKDVDFMWFGLRQGPLAKYSRLIDYRYDAYALISKYRPRIISSRTITNMDHPVIRDHYRQITQFPMLYLLQD